MTNLKAIPVLGRTSYLVIPNNIDLNKLRTAVNSIEKDLLEGKKIRVIWENTNFSSEIDSCLNNLSLKINNLNFQPYKTIFYKLNLEDIESQMKNYPEVNWSKYASDYNFKLIMSIQDIEYKIMENFVLNSNGVEFKKTNGLTKITPNQEMQSVILKKLPEILTTSENNIYLVSKKDSSEYVGCFDLVKVNEEEVQLHYTSGKAINIPLFSGKKMPILTAAMLEILKTSFTEFKYLTFSNKDEATKSVYQGVGFKPEPKRQCILVKQNLSEADIK